MPNSKTPKPAPGRTASFRLRAEAQARDWLKQNKITPGLHPHWLKPADAAHGRNFLRDGLLSMVKTRADAGKGINLDRTTTNLLSSQAMAFNIFGPLVPQAGCALPAADVLRACWPSIATVDCIRFEYTPEAGKTPESDPFGDQSAQGGIDADVRIDFRHVDGARGVLLIETKFVETGFSTCAYRGRAKTVCPSSTIVAADGGNCCYSIRARKPFSYWEQATQHGVLDMSQVRSAPCPFGGGLWQPWLNYTLAVSIAAAEIRATPADPVRHAWYGVVAPRGNSALHAETPPDAISALRRYLSRPDDVRLVAVEDIIAAIASLAGSAPGLKGWVAGLRSRYLVA